MEDTDKMPNQSETYLKDHTYNIVYTNKDGEQVEGYYTPTKDTTKVGVMAGFKNENPDYFKLVKITESKKVEGMEEITAGNIKKKAMEILPKEDIDVHDSDLYLKVSDKSTELVNQMKDKDSGLLSKFKSQTDGKMWYEIPFANMEDGYNDKVQEAIEPSPLFKFKNGDINRGQFDEIADKESPEYKYMNHEINWAEYDKLADHNSPDYKYLNNEINFGEYAKLNEGKVQEYIEKGYSDEPLRVHEFDSLSELQFYIRDMAMETLNGEIFDITEDNTTFELFDPKGSDGEVYVYNMNVKDDGSVIIKYNSKDSYNMNESKKVESKEDNIIKVGDQIAVVDYEDANTVGYNIYENEEDYEKDIVMDYYEVSRETAEQDIKELMTDVFNQKKEQEIYYLQDKILDYEKNGVGTKEEYEANLERLHHLQSFDGFDSSLFENKSLTESDDTVTEYVITFTDMDKDDEIFNNQEDADKRFEELRINGEIKNVQQYFRKDWELNNGEYTDGYTEVFYTQGDVLEEDANMSGYVHIRFTDGSNPYIKFTDNRKEVDAELKKWSKNFNITIDEDNTGKVNVTAEPKRKDGSDLFNFDEDELEEN